MKVAIRPVGVAYSEVLASLQAQCFDEHWGASSIAALIAGPGGQALLAVEAGPVEPSPVGFALFRTVAEETELLAIGVLPAVRQRGLGHALLACVLKRAEEAAARTIVLEVAVDNTAAQALYLAAGFTEVGIRSLYYWRPGAPPVDARILRLDLEGTKPATAG